jgi:hypothetical protein
MGREVEEEFYFASCGETLGLEGNGCPATVSSAVLACSHGCLCTCKRANQAVAIRYCDSRNIVSEVEEAISTGAGARAGADASAAGAIGEQEQVEWEWEDVSDGGGAGWDSAGGGAAEEERLMQEPICPESADLSHAMGKLQCGSGRYMILPETTQNALSRAESCTCKLVCNSSRKCATGVLVDGRKLGLPHFCILTCAVSAHSPMPPSSLSTDCFVVIKHVVTLSDDKWVAHFGDGKPISLEMPSPLDYYNFATPCGK